MITGDNVLTAGKSQVEFRNQGLPPGPPLSAPPRPVLKGRAVIFGAKEPRPIVNIPPDAMKVRLRLRNDRIAQAFVKFIDRVEMWTIEPANGFLNCPDWKLGWRVAVNHTAFTRPFYGSPL